MSTPAAPLTRARPQGSWSLAAVVLALVVALAVGGWVLSDLVRGAGSREAEVAERGARVMPFDLERTTHVFRATSDGGVQEVVSDDAVDPEQVALIRGHLREEAIRFTAGDFADPAAIHGDDMPGLAVLRARHDDVDVAYAELAAGARITYRSRDPEVVDALHAWFDAQLADHGGHARAG
jgi:hypothetical protein